MSGAMRRIGEYLGLLEDTGRYDDYADDPADTETTMAGTAEDRRPAPVADLAERRRPAPVPTPTTTVTEMSRITTLHPRTYNEARVIGESFRDGTPVIMECNPRATAGVSEFTASGVNLLYLNIKRCLGEPLPELTPKYGVIMKRRYQEMYCG